VVGDVEALAVVMPDSLAATPVASAVMWVMVLSAVGTFPVARTVSQPYTATQVLVRAQSFCASFLSRSFPARWLPR